MSAWFNQLGWAPAGVLVMLVLLVGGFTAVAVSEYRLHKRTQRSFRINRQWTVGRDVRS